MDANRFDTLAKELTGTRSRRSALGAAIAGGVLGALGLGRESPAHAAQDDRCEVPGAGGTCVLDFEAILREGPSAGQPLVAGGSPGRLRGYLMFTRGRTGDLEDATLLLDDGSSLPVSGFAIGQGFQARIDVGRGQALVAVGVGEPDFTRCLGRVDGTVTSTVVGDLGEWHGMAGVQNIPGSFGGGNQSTGSGNRPASSGSGVQLAQGNTPTPGRSSGNTGSASGDATSEGNGTRPVIATSGNGSGNTPNGSGNAPSTGNGSSPGSRGSNQPANTSGGNRPGNGTNGGGVVEERQDTGDPATTLACPESETRCSNACVNLQTNGANCGRCGNACGDTQSCLAGTCTSPEAPCPQGQTRCSGTCVTTTSDVLNCGGCGTVCALDEACTAGKCLAIEADDGDDGAGNADDPEPCAQGQTRCGAACTDLQTDETNCGLCGTTCAAGEECVAGKCTPPAPTLCPEGQVRCDGVCKEALPNYGTEGISCPGGGAAPTECPAGRELCNGACFPVGTCQPTECAPGSGYCYGVCRNLQNDPGACGKCGTSCPGGICLNGSCLTCPEGHMPCNGSCVNVQGDPNHCGFCNNVCGTQCIDGRCTGVGPTPGCAPGATRCGDRCVDLTSDINNCGKCGVKCDPNYDYCAPPGVCKITQAYCDTFGQRACHSACYPKSYPDHCGGCDQVCPGGYVCDADLEVCYIIGGSKRDGVKPKPRQTLAPEEQQTLAPVDQQTLAPSDEIACADGLDVCAGACTDLSTDPLNCGDCGTTCSAGDVCQQGECSASSPSSDAQTLVPVDEEPQTEPEPEPDANAPESAPASTSCPEGQFDCGGVCTDLSSDPRNCGNCGIDCGADISCDFGVCGEPPALIAAENETQPAPEAETVAPVTPPESTDGEPVPELEPVTEPVVEPVAEPVLEPDPVQEPEPDPVAPAPESVPAETETEPAS